MRKVTICFCFSCSRSFFFWISLVILSDSTYTSIKETPNNTNKMAVKIKPTKKGQTSDLLFPNFLFFNIQKLLRDTACILLSTKEDIVTGHRLQNVPQTQYK